MQQVSHWQASQDYTHGRLTDILRDSSGSVRDAAIAMCLSIPEDMLHQVIASRMSNSGCNQGACVQRDAVDTLLTEMKLLALYQDIVGIDTAQGEQGYGNEKRLMYIYIMCEDVIVEIARDVGWSHDGHPHPTNIRCQEHTPNRFIQTIHLVGSCPSTLQIFNRMNRILINIHKI